jgi:hypothetical protein
MGGALSLEWKVERHKVHEHWGFKRSRGKTMLDPHRRPIRISKREKKQKKPGHSGLRPDQQALMEGVIL